MAEDTDAPALADAPETTRANEPEAAPHPVEARVQAWVDQHIRNSPVSRASDAWNHLTAALPALVAALKEV